MNTGFQTKKQASLLSRMRRLVFGKRWRKAGEGTSGKNETDCSGKRRILRKHVKRISMETEACCLEKRNGVTWERHHSGAGNAARCMCWRSALHQPSHRTAFSASPFSFFSQGTIAFSVKRLSPPLPARRTPSGGAVKRKPPLAPSLCGKFKRGRCFILSLCIHPLTFP